MNWLIKMFGGFVDQAFQRSVKNWKTTAGGVGAAAAFELILNELTRQGCDLETIRPMGLFMVVQGLWSTDANKTVARTEGDDAHDAAGQG